jgi:hypothetical protein
VSWSVSTRVILSTRCLPLSVTLFGRFGVLELYLGMSDIHFMMSLFDPSVGVGPRLSSLM